MAHLRKEYLLVLLVTGFLFSCSSGEIVERAPSGRKLTITTADQTTVSVYESDLADNGILCADAELGNASMAYGLLNEQLSAGAAKIPVCYTGKSKSDSDCDYRYIRRPYQVSAPTVSQSQSRYLVCVSLSRVGNRAVKTKNPASELPPALGSHSKSFSPVLKQTSPQEQDSDEETNEFSERNSDEDSPPATVSSTRSDPRVREPAAAKNKAGRNVFRNQSDLSKPSPTRRNTASTSTKEGLTLPPDVPVGN